MCEMCEKKITFLLYFAQEFTEFRHAEIQSLIKFHNIDLDLPKESFEKPYLVVSGVSESDVIKIAERSVLLRFVAEVWASGHEYQTFHENLQAFHIDDKYISQDKSFKILVECYNKKVKLQQKVEKIETMSYLPFLGNIDLENPDHEYVYFEYYGMSTQIPEHPHEIIFGRKISNGRRNLIKSISLKTRKFIGNTSMNEQISLLMANMSLCGNNDLVYDPFCGTGSLLIPPAIFGSYVIGSDIDYLMLHAKSKPSRVQQRVRDEDESVRANMEQYNLHKHFLGIFIGDFSNCPLSDKILFDAIITDPPYGIREAISKVEKKEQKKDTVLQQDALHYPSLSNYMLHNLYDDLLEFCVKHLKMAGRAVFFIPIARKEYSEDMIPKHTALKLIYNCEQKLVGQTSRRLLVYEKISDCGQILHSNALKDVNFREKYFSSDDGTRQERRTANHQHNIEQAKSRGISIKNKTEWKKSLNKKRFAPS